MHGVAQRLNNVVSFTLSLLALLIALCALTPVYFKFDDFSTTFRTNRLRLMNVPDFTTDSQAKDFGAVTFDLKVNLSPAFNWNVKQLFVYLTAEYQTKKNAFNQVVIWDKIVLRDGNATINMKDVATEYYFFDDGNGLIHNKNLSLSLSWNTIPEAGLLSDYAVPKSHPFQFPNEYN